MYKLSAHIGTVLYCAYLSSYLLLAYCTLKEILDDLLKYINSLLSVCVRRTYVPCYSPLECRRDAPPCCSCCTQEYHSQLNKLYLIIYIYINFIIINCILPKKFELTNNLVACKRHKLERRRVKYLEEFQLNVHKNLVA